MQRISAPGASLPAVNVHVHRQALGAAPRRPALRTSLNAARPATNCHAEVRATAAATDAATAPAAAADDGAAPADVREDGGAPAAPAATAPRGRAPTPPTALPKQPRLSRVPRRRAAPLFGDDPPGHRAGFVALVGRPNAGKSSLMNALVGQPLSIVTPKAQTTRHRLLGVLSEPLWQAAFLDTPGVIADRRDALEERMMAAVEEAARDADALLLVVDAADRPREALALVRPAVASALARGVKAAVALNKVDLLGWEEHDALVADFKEDAGADAVISVSAKQTLGLPELTAWVAAQLPESPALFARSDVAAAPERFFVAEIVRKHLFLALHQELPYGMTAEVVEWKERRAPYKPRVSVVVYVEQERHKGMVIGAGGAGVKALGVAARAEAEAFLGREIFLDLAVKVAPKWRESKESVEARGY